VDGFNEKKYIRKKARESGVTILTPREFYGDIHEHLQSALFMKRFNEGAEDYIAKASHPDFMRDAMLLLQAYYKHVLYGITQGRNDALPVRLGSVST
jgi:hypothetical protein